MSEARKPNYWIFSNDPIGSYGESIWDMATILKRGIYTFKKRAKNRRHVQQSDLVYFRIFGQSFIGKCEISGPSRDVSLTEQDGDAPMVEFPISNVVLWDRPLPWQLVFSDLSTKDKRSRIAGINRDDGLIIEAAQRTYSRLGFGDADDQIVVLEKGLEEAIKPNLKKLGLHLAGKAIQQQFDMGAGGRSDLICLDENDDLVVLELKRGKTSDESIGQVLRYVGWLRENIAEEGQKVKGWIVAGDYDEHLRLAALAANVRLVVVRLG